MHPKGGGSLLVRFRKYRGGACCSACVWNSGSHAAVGGAENAAAGGPPTCHVPHVPPQADLAGPSADVEMKRAREARSEDGAEQEEEQEDQQQVRGSCKSPAGECLTGLCCDRSTA